MTLTYGGLLTQAARGVHDGAAHLQHCALDDHSEALRALADFHGVLDALQTHVWALVGHHRATGLTSSLHPEPAEITALTLAEAITALTGSVRPHPSLLRPALDPWAHAAQLVRAANDLIATHHEPDGTPRSPDAATFETAHGRAACLARLGDLAGAVLAVEDTLALRAGQAGIGWPEVRRWLPGLAHLRAQTHQLATTGNARATVQLDHVGLIGAPVRTDDPLTELADRLTRLRQSTWQLVASPDRSITTLGDIAAIGVAVHAHAARFHGADVTTPTPAPAGDLDRLIQRGRTWQDLHRRLRPLVSPAPRDDVVHEDLIGIVRALRTIAPLDPAAPPRASAVDPHTRHVGAALGGAVAVMADIGDHSARAFRRITTSSTLRLPARHLTGTELTERPDLAQAHLTGKLTPVPQHHLDAITDLYQTVRAHPIPTPAPLPPPTSVIEAALTSHEPITRQAVQQ